MQDTIHVSEPSREGLRVSLYLVPPMVTLVALLPLLFFRGKFLRNSSTRHSRLVLGNQRGYSQ